MTEQDRCRQLAKLIYDKALGQSLDELEAVYDFQLDLEINGHTKRVVKLREQMAAERGNDEPTVPGRVL